MSLKSLIFFFITLRGFNTLILKSILLRDALTSIVTCDLQFFEETPTYCFVFLDDVLWILKHVGFILLFSYLHPYIYTYSTEQDVTPAQRLLYNKPSGTVYFVTCFFFRKKPSYNNFSKSIHTLFM